MDRPACSAPLARGPSSSAFIAATSPAKALVSARTLTTSRSISSSIRKSLHQFAHFGGFDRRCFGRCQRCKHRRQFGRGRLPEPVRSPTQSHARPSGQPLGPPTEPPRHPPCNICPIRTSPARIHLPTPPHYTPLANPARGNPI